MILQLTLNDFQQKYRCSADVLFSSLSTFIVTFFFQFSNLSTFVPAPQMIVYDYIITQTFNIIPVLAPSSYLKCCNYG